MDSRSARSPLHLLAEAVEVSRGRARARLERLAAALLVLLGTFAAGRAAALVPDVRIQAEAVDLVDSAPGEDLWLYRYTVQGFDASPAHGLSIFFDHARTSALTLDGLAAAPAEWDVLVLQPDALLPADGLFDALALEPPGSSSGPLEVAFVWSGDAPPGVQDFVLYDEQFAPIAAGLTRLVPEPTTGLLVGVGLASLGARRRAMRRNGRKR
jgi:hypothetical protein